MSEPKRAKKLDISILVQGSDFEKVFEKYKAAKDQPNFKESSCLLPCQAVFSQSGAFHRHLATQHTDAYFEMCWKKKHEPNSNYVNLNTWEQYKQNKLIVPVNPIGDVYMEIDNQVNLGPEEVTDNDETDVDTDEDEMAYDLDAEVVYDLNDEQDDIEVGNAQQNVDLDIDEIVQIIRDPLLQDDALKFLEKLEKTFDKKYYDYAIYKFRRILEERLTLNIPLSSHQFVTIRNLNDFQLFPGFSTLPSTEIFDDIIRFANSDHLQKAYIDKLHTYIPPTDLTIKGTTIGQRVNLKQLTKLILEENYRIVESIRREKTDLPFDGPFELYSSEMTCCHERKKRMQEFIRYRFGGDDLTIAQRNITQKYLAIYVTFENIPPKFRLKRSDVYPIYLARRSKMKAAGIVVNDILELLAEELSSIYEDGIDVNIQTASGQTLTINVKGVLSAMCGDNLGSYEFGGWKMAFSEGYICRYCSATGDEVQSSNARPIFGTEETFEKDLQDYNDLIDSAEEGQPFPPNRFGLTGKCALSKCACIFTSFPPDPTHDIPEGVLKKIMLQYILKFGIQLKPTEILDRVNGFTFYYGQINLTHNSGKYNMTGAKAVQRLEFLARLHEIFPEEMNLKSIEFELYTLLTNFTILAFSHEIKSEEVGNFNKWATRMIDICLEIDARQKAKRKSNKNSNKKEPKTVYPKLHHLLHYSELTEMYGPPVQYSTLDFERKHLDFKGWAEVMGNYRNPPKSLMVRHQMRLALDLSEGTFRNTELFDRNPPSLESVIVHEFQKGADKISEKDMKNYNVKSKLQPRQLNKNLCFKIVSGGRVQYWMHPTDYLFDPNGSGKIMAKGKVYVLMPHKFEGFEVIQPRWIADKFVFAEHLHHQNNFIFKYHKLGELGQAALIRGTI